MTPLAVLSRVVTWFGGQGQVARASILGLLSDEMLAVPADGQLAQRDEQTVPATRR